MAKEEGRENESERGRTIKTKPRKRFLLSDVKMQISSLL
jgi:hypothetical protein